MPDACQSQPLFPVQQGSQAQEAIFFEWLKAMKAHAPMHSAHEGFAVLLEEVEELKAEVFRRHRDPDAMRKEAVQVGAMALRFLVDVCSREG